MKKATINKSAGRDHSPVKIHNENNISIKIANPETKKIKRKSKPRHEPTLEEIEDSLNNLEYSDQAITSQTAPSYGSGGSIQLPIYHNQNPYALMNQQTEPSVYPPYHTLKFRPEYSKTIEDIPNNANNGPIIEEIDDEIDDEIKKRRGRPPGSKNKVKTIFGEKIKETFSHPIAEPVKQVELINHLEEPKEKISTAEFIPIKKSKKSKKLFINEEL